ncbi:FAD binding domain-containing protein [Ktedonospora formicarum]|uniref:FAD-binding molybdopterin dehydrogenase n=1 Tax=Ktedonospora formicarum TaxID=2778364 RepID=A0A8J3MTW1_9CHLR|nr:FAD binding domain-containing protein [Ktedonospora formicarum]GHO46018.1 FAD-binding molybdopterin dehydrogenase [Ktedonospora formicarum]
MDLTTIKEVKRPESVDMVAWREGYAWLAGGTWLFSEPQLTIDTLIDLEQLHWPALQISEEGLDIAATCPIVELERFVAPPQWIATSLLNKCCHSFLASFKVLNTATVGGNICMSLPAGPMISLTIALEGIYTLWPREGSPRQIPAVQFVTGNHMNVLQPGELLRSIYLPVTALTRRFAFRRLSSTHFGRSTSLIIGTQDRHKDDLLLTITAATSRPVQLRFDQVPSTHELRSCIETTIPETLYFDDPYGTSAYRRHITYYYAEQIRAELAQKGAWA